MIFFNYWPRIAYLSISIGNLDTVNTHFHLWIGSLNFGGFRPNIIDNVIKLINSETIVCNHKYASRGVRASVQIPVLWQNISWMIAVDELGCLSSAKTFRLPKELVGSLATTESTFYPTTFADTFIGCIFASQCFLIFDKHSVNYIRQYFRFVG